MTPCAFYGSIESMLQSALFTKTRKEIPADEVSKNAILLIKASFVNKEMAGVYSYLPLGLRVINKIEMIIRDEMNQVGGQEILMSVFHPKENWEKTGRWETMDDLYKVKDSSGREVALGPTHEEIVVPLVKQYVNSYRDLPLSVYQIQNKFRMELRAKSGVLRGREFIMKDMYSFHKDEEDLKDYYEKVKIAYKKIFDRIGIGHVTYFTFASGGSFSKFSHEFQTITESGEDIIYVDEERGIAVNREVYNDEVLNDLNLDKSKLIEKKAIEVGNIFELKTKYSAPFDMTYRNENDENKTIIMGCYGMGVSRLLGTLAEVCSDSNGIIWPEAVAPFLIHILPLGASENISDEAKKLYNDLIERGFEVLLDDRASLSAGEKFADADLIGIPYRVVVSERSLKEGGVEVKKRAEEKGEVVSVEKFIEMIKHNKV